MIQPITFFVEGLAKPAGSKRAFALKKGGVFTGRVGVTDDCEKSKDWKADVLAAAMPFRPSEPLTGALSIRVTFHMPRIKGHFRTGKNANVLRGDAPIYHTVKPDSTKLLRGLEDALTGIIWRDDAQIAHQVVSKVYGTRIGAEVKITEL